LEAISSCSVVWDKDQDKQELDAFSAPQKTLWWKDNPHDVH